MSASSNGPTGETKMAEKTMRPAFNTSGLVPAVAQDAVTGAVLMMAWMNEEAWLRTLETNQAWYYSRSRQTLWRKGESSGNTQRVVDLRLDCDRDTVLLLVEQSGPACHTGAPTCFFSKPTSPASLPPVPPSALASLRATLERRIGASADTSYTARLIQKGPDAIGSKLQEEALELANAVRDESDDRVVSECADLIYFALVGLTSRGLEWRAVEAEIHRRFGVSGLVEKASRRDTSASD